MKRLFMILLLAWAVQVQAQEKETYSLVYNNPDDLNYGYVSFNYLGIDAGFKNTTGAMMAYGLEAYYPVTNRIGVEGMVTLPYYGFDNSVSASLFEIGGDFAVVAGNKLGDMGILLSLSWSDDMVTNERTTTYKFVNFTAEYRRDLVARGGFYRHRSAYEYEFTELDYEVVEMTHSGVYVGFGQEIGKFAHIKNNGNDEVRAYGGLSKLYADVMLLPTEVKATRLDESKKATLGWRLGWKMHITPYKKDKTILKERAGFFANSFFRVEFGQRPHDGVFVTTTFGFAPIKL